MSGWLEGSTAQLTSLFFNMKNDLKKQCLDLEAELRKMKDRCSELEEELQALKDKKCDGACQKPTQRNSLPYAQPPLRSRAHLKRKRQGEAHTCNDCRVLEELGLDMVEAVSRHRGSKRPITPPNWWNPGWVSPQKEVQKGAQNEEK